MRKNLKELFKWRDWSVHPPADFRDPVLYPELHVSTEWRFVAFRKVNAHKALWLALRLIAQLVKRPKEGNESLAQKCADIARLLDPIVEQWETKYGELYPKQSEEVPARID